MLYTDTQYTSENKQQNVSKFRNNNKTLYKHLCGLTKQQKVGQMEENKPKQHFDRNKQISKK